MNYQAIIFLSLFNSALFCASPRQTRCAATLSLKKKTPPSPIAAQEDFFITVEGMYLVLASKPMSFDLIQPSSAQPTGPIDPQEIDNLVTHTLAMHKENQKGLEKLEKFLRGQ